MKVLNDLLWDGELKIYQDTDSFMFSLDSVLLSNFVTINKSTKKILDIGTGNAPIPLMLTKRTDAFIDAVEIQKKSYNLAVESIKYNKLDKQINVIYGDINELYKNLGNNCYDIIISNPPYYSSDMLSSLNNNKKIARNDDNLTLDNIFMIAKRLLKNNGNIAIVIDTKRLVDVILTMKLYSIEPKKIQFVYPKINKISNILLIEGTKNGKPGLKILNPIILQDDKNNYTKDIEKLLNEFGKY